MSFRWLVTCLNSHLLTLNTFSTLIVYAYTDGWYTPCHSNMVFIFELNHTSSSRSNMNREWDQIDNEFMLLLVLLLSSFFFFLFSFFVIYFSSMKNFFMFHEYKMIILKAREVIQERFCKFEIVIQKISSLSLYFTS